LPTTQNQQTEEELDVGELLKVIIVQQQRIYDTLLAILNTSDKETANALLKKHEDFGYLGPMPFEVES
jgi:hypothetical protein